MVITTISSVDAINIWFEDSQPPTDGRLYIQNRTRIMVVPPQPGRSVPYIMMNNSDHEFLFDPMLNFGSPTNASSFMSAVIGGVEPGAGPEVADEIAAAAFSVEEMEDLLRSFDSSVSLGGMSEQELCMLRTEQFQFNGDNEEGFTIAAFFNGCGITQHVLFAVPDLQ
nr:hypothetical protein Iba_chr08cCG2640 [Ipomoea batatas]